MPGAYSSYLYEAIMRLGTWMPFERLPAELHFFTHATVSVETARRLTEGGGAALVTAQTEEVERLERELPPSPTGPEMQHLSADGAMVPLVGGQWAEVKTLALGTVEQRATKSGERVAHTTDLRYFSRLADAEQFGRLATLATHAGGTARAGTVCAVVDGADWLQGFIDLHRPDAVRILDFPHAAEHISDAAHAVLGEGTPAAKAWLDAQLHELKHGNPDTVLVRLAALPTMIAEGESLPAGAQDTCDAVSAYLTKRRAQIAYARFRAQGYPIGDGCVESANKLVVEHRLKGSGMRWERRNVNPMVALRSGACSDQWTRDWVTITQRLGQQHRDRRRSRWQNHRLAVRSAPQSQPAPAPSPPAASPTRPRRETLVIDGRPTANHPWRAFRLPGSRDFSPNAKL
ncbi:MAG: hypothetical protein PVSMB7_19340 [Chloroflexota bacterium]